MGTQQGLDVMEMAPKPGKSPKRRIEVIDATGNVTVLEYDKHTADWRYHLKENGFEVVAVLEGPEAVRVEHWVDGQGTRFRGATPKATTAMSPELERIRAEHGYRIVRGDLGRMKVEVIDSDSEIGMRRLRARAVLDRQKQSRPANRMNLSDAAAMIAGQHAPAGGAQSAEIAQLRAQLDAQSAQINQLLAALGGNAPAKKTKEQ